MQSLNDLKILVNDDEADLRELLLEELAAEGAKVFSAENGKAGFEIATRENVDLVVSDVRMPLSTGIEFVEKVRAIHFSKPEVILITGFSDVSTDDTYNIGAAAIFSKPFKISHVIQTLKNLTQSFEERYAQKPACMATQQILLKFKSLPDALSSGQIKLGRGGVFLQLEQAESLYKAGPCSIRIEFQEGPTTCLQFEGVIQWRRSATKNGKPPGLGAEFQYISDECRASLGKMVQDSRPIAFIPNG